MVLQVWRLMNHSPRNKAEPSRSYTDVEPTYEEVEHWPDSSELEADEA